MGATSRRDARGRRVCYMPEPPPAYVRIADDLREAIRGGRYAPGDELPTLAALQGEYEAGGVNTVRNALAILRAEKLITSGGGKRTKVVDPLPPLPEETRSESERVQAQIADLQAQIAQLRRELEAHEH
jgi:DNA-binding GntR family transcriptional regulator